MKRWMFLVIIITLFISGCGLKEGSNEIQDKNVAGKVYVYEKEGVCGEFLLMVKEDGTFSYSEGPVLSSVHIGNWNIDGDLLVLCEEIEEMATRRYYFKIEKGCLVYMADKSNEFFLVRVKNGERFLKKTAE